MLLVCCACTLHTAALRLAQESIRGVTLTVSKAVNGVFLRARDALLCLLVPYTAS